MNAIPENSVTNNESCTYKYDSKAVTGKNGPMYHVAHNARERADYCGKCFRFIQPDEPVVHARIRVTYGPPGKTWGRCTTVVCLDCGLDRHGSRTYPCEVCGRLIHYPLDWQGGFRSRGRSLCSRQCEWKWRNRQTSKRRAQERLRNPHSVICNACGRTFNTTGRGDTRYCSPACRQKAYRQRRAAP